MSEPDREPQATTTRSPLALVMSGGGARAAYQVGFLTAVAERFPTLSVDVLTGVSAGAINAVFLASRPDLPFAARIEELAELWRRIRVDHVMRTRALGLFLRAGEWMLRLASGGHFRPRRLRGMVDTEPLRVFLRDTLNAPDGRLPGVRAAIETGALSAVAITGTSYSTGRSVTFVEGKDILEWERPTRISRGCELTVEHVMASAALPMLFPAVRVGDEWFGDGGIRLSAPLAPAVHLGAERILAITTRYGRTSEEAARPTIEDYPPPSRVAGVLLSAIFLDLLDADALRLQRINSLVTKLPPDERNGLRPIGLSIWRPSQDLGKLANRFEADLPWALRFGLRGTGTKEESSNDFLSLIMFQPDYIEELLTLGRADAERQMDSIVRFLEKESTP